MVKSYNSINKNDFDGFLKFGSPKKFNKKSGRSKHSRKKKNSDYKFGKLIKNKRNQMFRSCSICNSKSTKNLFTKNNFIHVMCKSCNFVFVNPILKPEVQLRELKNEKSYTEVMKNKNNIKLDKIRFNYGLQKLNNKKKKKKILDYGCGYGLFLDEALKNGWSVFANEINKKCINYLNSKKIELDNNFTKNKYDAISLWLVLEHIPEPNLLLKKVYNALKKGGKILVNVPNFNSLSSLVLKEKCSMFSGEQHVNHFTANTLEKILNKNKFKVKKMETIISDAGTVRNYLNYDDPYNGEAKKIYSFTDVNYIHKNLLGYTLFCIAEKK